MGLSLVLVIRRIQRVSHLSGTDISEVKRTGLSCVPLRGVALSGGVTWTARVVPKTGSHSGEKQRALRVRAA